ncbi:MULTISPECIES: efflux RND transporter periplasmic adaptor subunit [Bradyrhizobium]|uniref:efflux RND transporter periplasmic adaptor subunit n=1 Tax=Bradyrhizobium TaxID=374 RepID=UPI000231D349|nr:efflux RND transporter periplasmic adaptor subunit [Bradyrhizobium japonicum]AJA64483.1 hemolysin D [Bradyrhizobium japonicum]KMJ93949.1 hemolysin D [Bradyrhizobium japonicum]MBR0761252.1 efflux RND transporter periplasmic adaptor subunit [Bradyrhizobium japonicum]MCS3538613.1 Cu(I)/Ag(I) efflux system membrane fusion protein [Bradyrhizobium japonicum]MCS3985300.1 Cu(I)/Ag(I) efflux system membrane fusion protein [Bradyrhizobium japonicum]
MKTLRLLTALVLGGGLVLAGDYWHSNGAGWLAEADMTSAAAAAERTPLYYRDPSGAPLWSAGPKKDDRGRDYLPVYDDDGAAVAPAPPKAQAASPRKILYYRNPMGLPDTSTVPKKDPMGMDYVAVYEGDDADDGTVKLSPGKIQRAGVKSEPVARRSIRVSVKAPGTIQLDERRVSVIAMRAESFVQKVADVTTGTRVKAGQPLMEIYSSAVASAAAEYLATITSKTVGGVEMYGRGSRQRLVNLDVPESVIAEMDKTRTAPVSIRWSAPRDGVVLERNAIEGMRANPGDVLFRIADTSVVWALVDVAERDLGNIAVGQSVAVRARSFPGRSFTGTIAVVYPQVNRDTRTVRVRIELANPDAVLLPDMYVDADIDTADAAPVLAIQDSAVLDTGSRQAVLVDKGEGRFEPREVKLGRRGGGYVEVRQGLADGEAVVTSANFLIDAESNLKAALKGFGEAASQASDAGPGDATGDRK